MFGEKYTAVYRKDKLKKNKFIFQNNLFLQFSFQKDIKIVCFSFLDLNTLFQRREPPDEIKKLISLSMKDYYPQETVQDMYNHFKSTFKNRRNGS